MLQLYVAWSKSSSVVLEVVATGGSRQCVFLIIGTWNLEMVMSWGDGEGVDRGEECRVFYQNFLSLFTWNRDQKGDEKPQRNVCYRPGDDPGTMVLEEWRNRWRSAVNLFASQVRVACLLPESASWVWGLRQSNEWEEGSLQGKMCVVHWRWVQALAQGMLQLMFCCWTGHESGELNLEEKKERRRPVTSLSTSMVRMTCGFQCLPAEAYDLSWTNKWFWTGRLGEKDLWDSL